MFSHSFNAKQFVTLLNKTNTFPAPRRSSDLSCSCDLILSKGLAAAAASLCAKIPFHQPLEEVPRYW